MNITKFCTSFYAHITYPKFDFSNVTNFFIKVINLICILLIKNLNIILYFIYWKIFK